MRSANPRARSDASRRVLLSGFDPRRTAQVAEAVRVAGLRVQRVLPRDLVEAVVAQRPEAVLLGPDEAALDGLLSLKKDRETRAVKVAVLTRPGDLAGKLVGLEAGADEVLSLPAERGELAAHVRALLQNSAGDHSVSRERAAAAGAVVRAIEAAVETRGLGGHARRVKRILNALADELKIRGPALAELRTAAEMQDLGMIALPDAARARAGPLRPGEWEAVRRHPLLSEKMALALGASADCGRTVRSHHERPDGRGYPDGLGRQRIPDGARLLAAANAFEALTAGRPYRAPVASADAVKEIERGARRGQFDPEVAAALAAAVKQGRLRALAAAVPDGRPMALVVGASPLAARVRAALRVAGFDPSPAAGEAAREALSHGSYALVVATADREPEPALDLLAYARETGAAREAILVCPKLDGRSMRDLVRAGASDLLDARSGPAELEAAFRAALMRAEERGARSKTRRPPAAGESRPALLGLATFDLTARAAALAAASEFAREAAERAAGEGGAPPGLGDAAEAAAACAAIARELIERAADLKALVGAPARESVDLGEAVGAACRLAEPLLAHVALERDLAPVPPVVGDPSDALGALVELLGWAARASGPRGRVRIATGIAGSGAWVRVEDTGATLSLDVRRALAGGADGDLHGPLGRASLAAQRMGGALEVLAREPRGNAVTLRLPAMPVAV